MIASSNPLHLQLNQLLQAYLQQNSQKKAQIRQDTIKIFKSNVALYEKFLTDNSTDSSANLLYGSTGVGKSAFYDFLKGFPLVLVNGKDNYGKLTGEIKLDVQAKAKLNSQVSPIEHSFMSGTAIPHVCKVDGTMIFDLPGQFQNRCILQAITSAVCRQKIAQRSKQIKVTILINHNDLKNRGSAFKQILQEVKGFIQIQKSKDLAQMFTLVVTQVPPSLKNAAETIKQTLSEIVSEVVDFGNTEKQIIRSIVQRGAIAVFFAPAKKIKAGSSDEIEYQNAEGQPYKPSTQGSVETTLAVIRKTPFAKCENAFFSANLNPNFKSIIDNVVNDLIEQTKNRTVVLAETIIKSKLPYIPASIQNETELATINSIIDLFQTHSETIKNQILFSSIQNIFSLRSDGQYINLRSDLSVFAPLTNHLDLDYDLMKVKDRVINLLQNNILNLVKSRNTLKTNLQAQRQRQAQQQARLKAEELQRQQQRVQNQPKPQKSLEQKILTAAIIKPAKQVERFFRKLF